MLAVISSWEVHKTADRSTTRQWGLARMTRRAFSWRCREKQRMKWKQESFIMESIRLQARAWLTTSAQVWSAGRPGWAAWIEDGRGPQLKNPKLA